MGTIVPVDATWIVTDGGGTPPPPPVATTAVEGSPGFFLPSAAPAPATFADLAGITAEPTTAWATGWVRLANDTLAHWNGSMWIVGRPGTDPGTGLLPLDFATPGIAYEWMTGSDERDRYTTAMIKRIAARYDVIIVNGNHFTQWIPAAREANPDVQVLLYQLGNYANVQEAGSTAASTWPEAWFAHTSTNWIPPNWTAIANAMAQTPKPRIQDVMRANKGNRIMTEEPFETFLMDPGNAGWRARATLRAQNAVNAVGYHGVMLDSMGFPNVGYVDAAPVNMVTGTTYKNTDWLAASALSIKDVKDTTGMFTGVNGLGNNALYFGGTNILAYASDMAMPERWMREPKGSFTAFPSTNVVKGSIDMIVDAEAKGASVGTCTKLWGTSAQPTVAQQDQWFYLCEAAFYCGTNGKSRMFFIKDGNTPAASGGVGGSNLDLQPSPVHPTLGTPTGAYVQAGAVFTRTFSNGFVALNSGTTTASIALPSGTYTRSDTAANVTGSVSLGASRGVVLVKV